MTGNPPLSIISTSLLSLYLSLPSGHRPHSPALLLRLPSWVSSAGICRDAFSLAFPLPPRCAHSVSCAATGQARSARSGHSPVVHMPLVAASHTHSVSCAATEALARTLPGTALASRLAAHARTASQSSLSSSSSSSFSLHLRLAVSLRERWIFSL